jgi:hypothetical protein
MLHGHRDIPRVREALMPMSRLLILLLFTVSTMSTLGHAQTVAPTSRSLAIDLARMNALNRNVVVADFNGDGIMDLAGSDVPSRAGNIPPTGFVSTSSTGFVSSATSSDVPAPAGSSDTLSSGNGPSPVTVSPADASVASSAGSVTVFGNGVSIPNGAANSSPTIGSVPSVVANQALPYNAAAAGAAPPANVTVFGIGVSTPNSTSAPPLGTVTPFASFPPATGTGASAPRNVAVFGTGVSIPNSTVPSSPAAAFPGGTAPFSITVPSPAGTSVTSPSSAAAFGGSVPMSNSSVAALPGGAAADASGGQSAAGSTPPSTAGNMVTDGTNAGVTANNGASAVGTLASPRDVALPGSNITSRAMAADSALLSSASEVGQATSAAGPVVVRLGAGNGTFRAPLRSWTSGDVLAAGDFNADKKTDLVVVTQPDNQVLLLQGTGDGRFRAAFAVGTPDRPDALTSNTPAASARQAGAAQAGTAQPAAAQADAAQTGIVQAEAAQLAARSNAAQPNSVTFALPADLDADGRLDLVVGAKSGSSKVFPGQGDFTFGPPVEIVTGRSANDGVVVDVNADGANDIVVASRAGLAVSIFLNQGGLLFTATDLPLDRQANDVAAADLNRDGRMDLVVAVAAGGDGETQFSEGFAYVLLGRGDGTFAQPVQYQVLPGTWQVVVGDFTRDGLLDIATANRSFLVQQTSVAAPNGSDTVSILPGNGDGTFSTASSFALGADGRLSDNRFRASVRSLSAADVNGDQTPDLVVSGGAILMSRAADGKAAAAVATAR